MLSFEEARARMLALAAATSATPETVLLAEAEGRVLAMDVTPPFDLPSFDHSTMDGYAVCADALPAEGGTLSLVGESRAGHAVPPLVAGTTMRIFTGAMLPEGADTIVMQEKVVVSDGPDTTVAFASRPSAGTNVRRRGSDLRMGEVAIARGTRLRPAHLGLCASCDLAEVSVMPRPRVVVLTNGDELRAPGAAGTQGQLPESNGVTIAAMARRAGATVVLKKTLPDEREAVAEALDEALATADLVITIGGVSVGDHDVVKGALALANVTLDFWRVAIKPGKPLAVGTRGHAVVLGLPGNPASAMVTFGLFGVPFVRALSGETDPLPREWPARLQHDVAHDPGRMELVRAIVSREGDGLVARAVRQQASGAGIGMALANALVLVPRDSEGLVAGAVVTTYAFEDLGL
jgi:molybdopterin molybdotransferase